MALPHVFATLPAGNVPASYLDDNFNSLLSSIAATIGTPQGRLSLTTLVPVLTGPVTGATSIWYTPYLGVNVPIYSGTAWGTQQLTGDLQNITTNSALGNAGPAACVANSNYDLFIWNNGGTLTLTRGPPWTSDTGRGTGAGTTQIQRVSGLFTNAVAIVNGPGANLGTYVGSFRTDVNSQANWQPGAYAAGCTAALLTVWNYYNRIDVKGVFGDTGNWNYSTATWRAANASNSARVSYLLGVAEDQIEVEYAAAIKNDTGDEAGAIGIGHNSTTTPTQIQGEAWTSGTQGGVGTARAVQQELGFNFMQALENKAGSGAGTTTWFGTGTIWTAVPFTGGITYRGRF